MTDGDIADKVYIEPLNVPTLTKIIEKENPIRFSPRSAVRQDSTLLWSLTKKAF